jgi:hypothetical protein
MRPADVHEEHPNSRLELARESFTAVKVDEQMHNSIIQSYLAGIAFLVAAVLAFVPRDALRSSYSFGKYDVFLPALTYVSFLVTIIFAVMLYILSASNPLTIPRRPFADDVGRRSSRLAFRIISYETQDSWQTNWSGDTKRIRDELTTEYVSSTLVLAERVDNRVSRAEEASALFILSLMFFLMSVVFSIDILTATSLAPVHDWSLGVRVSLTILLVCYVDLLIYERLRGTQTIDAIVRRGRVAGGFYLILSGYASYIVCVAVPLGGTLAWRTCWAGGVVLGAALLCAGYWSVLRHSRRGRWAAVFLTVTFGLAGGVAIVGSFPLAQLCLATGAAASPLLGTPIESAVRQRRRLSSGARLPLARMPENSSSIRTSVNK